MKKTTKITIIAYAILAILLLGYYSFIYYTGNIKPRRIANEYNLELVVKFGGPYYKILQGIETTSQRETFLIFVRNVENPYLVYEKEGITKEDAAKIAETKGYNVERVRLSLKASFLGTYNKEDIKPYLIWNVTYDEKNAQYLEIEFTP